MIYEYGKDASNMLILRAGAGAGAEAGPGPGMHGRKVGSALTKPVENAFHCIYARDVEPGLMIAAPLTVDQSQAAPDIGIARARTAQMDHGGQLLFAIERREFHMVAFQSAGHAAIEICRRARAPPVCTND